MRCSRVRKRLNNADVVSTDLTGKVMYLNNLMGKKSAKFVIQREVCDNLRNESRCLESLH